MKADKGQQSDKGHVTSLRSSQGNHTPGPWFASEEDDKVKRLEGGFWITVTAEEIIAERDALKVQNSKLIEVIQALQAQACDNGCAQYNDVNGKYLKTEHTRACKQARAVLSKVAAKP